MATSRRRSGINATLAGSLRPDMRRFRAERSSIEVSGVPGRLVVYDFNTGRIAIIPPGWLGTDGRTDVSPRPAYFPTRGQAREFADLAEANPHADDARQPPSARKET